MRRGLITFLAFVSKEIDPVRWPFLDLRRVNHREGEYSAVPRLCFKGAQKMRQGEYLCSSEGRNFKLSGLGKKGGLADL